MSLIVAFLFLTLSFAGTSVALAQVPDDGLSELAKPVLDAVLSGNYTMAAALGLVLAVALARVYGSKLWPALGRPLAGSIMVLLGAFGAALANSAGAGAALSLTMVWGALKVAVLASGSYSLLKPWIKWLDSKGPSWLAPVLRLVTWIFNRPDREAEAEAAGLEAVAEHPAEGAGVDFTNAP